MEQPRAKRMPAAASCLSSNQQPTIFHLFDVHVNNTAVNSEITKVELIGTTDRSK